MHMDKSMIKGIAVGGIAMVVLGAGAVTGFNTMRKPEFAEVVERAFARLAGSREIVAIYERWFQKSLPSGLRLNLPMSPHLEEIFRVQGLPSD